MKIKLYIDFDGVILDTIAVTYERLAKLNITEEKDITEYYKNISWEDLIKESPELKESTKRIKQLVNSNLYEVYVLTHVVTEQESQAKAKFLKEKINFDNIISVFKGNEKCDVVDSKNAILVDDFVGNLVKWKNKSGFPIKFSDKNKKSKFYTITDLKDLLDNYEEISRLISNNNLE